MIQNFDVQGGPDFGRTNLPKLRAALAKKNLDGFLIPHEDEYNNEYLPDCNERLMWATGFTGSAGAAIVLTERAAVFVDGRYTLQVKAQVDENLYAYKRVEDAGVTTWLKENVSEGDKIGYDAKLHSPDALTRLKKAVEAAGGKLIAVETNPIDEAWTDRPAPPKAKLTIQPLELAGRDHEEKRTEIAKIVEVKGADAALITSPSSIAWLLNIRGGDVMCSPLPLASLILHKDGNAELFVDPDKVSEDIRAHLGNQVSINDETKLTARINDLKGKAVLIDPSSSASFMFDTLDDAGAKIVRGMDPIALPKAKKNKAEIEGTTAAHVRDGAAVTKFLHWLATDAQSGNVDEIEAAQKLESFRAETGLLKDLSFESISGAGSNGAIVHYRVSKATTKKLAKGSLYLIDSGGQYVDGTTDITRTVPIGTPTDEMRKCFTLVLKGHIALSQIRFPKGTTGHAIDSLARMALWAHGFDYDHGTGHGVGVYLGVHEGPQRIAKSPSSIALEPGMIVSNEPGYYKTDGFGIRIENLQYVTEAAPIKGGERDMMGFETITLSPIEPSLIIKDLLSPNEIDWLNDYHARVLEEIGPLVSDEVRKWLATMCAAI
ncbi:MAG: aminopeptidase P family protein [Acidimicrobiales bacterium]|nr:aminopeptidase P family protein [Hyphomonadaceae bacterium]RZV42392.1 MAG: aminopeptidase P family protein [Acidimicrobiales bacterium]